MPAGAQVFSGQWAVRAESDAPSPPNALCQTGEADFPAIDLDTRPYTDLTLVARFTPSSGKEDQAGGLIFRVQDKDNHYIARANALEDQHLARPRAAAKARPPSSWTHNTPLAWAHPPPQALRPSHRPS